MPARNSPVPLQRILDRIGWTVVEAAARANVSRATMTRWAKGQTRAPWEIARWLVAVAIAIERLPPPPHNPAPRMGKPLMRSREGGNK